MCGCGPAGRVLWWALVDCTCMVVVFLVVLCPSALLSCVSQHGVSRLQQIVLRGGGGGGGEFHYEGELGC